MNKIYSNSRYFFWIKINLLCLFFGVLSTLVNAQDTDKKIVIAGKIDGYNQTTDNRFITFYFDDLLESHTSEVCQINENGEFVHTTKRPFAQDFIAVYNENSFSVFASPGDSLYIQIDNKKFNADTLGNLSSKAIKFSGSHKEFNRNLIRFYKYYNTELYHFAYEDSMMIHLSPMEYKTYLDQRTINWHDRIDELNVSNKATQEFSDWVEINKQFNNYAYLMLYTWLHPYRNKLDRDSFLVAIPSEYFAFLSEEYLNNRFALDNSAYYRFMDDYSSYLLNTMPADSVKKMTQFYKNKEFTEHYLIKVRQIKQNAPPLEQDILLAALYYQILNQGKFETYVDLEEQYPVQESELKELLQQQYIQTKVYLNDSKVWEGIHLYNGLEMNTQNVLDSILLRHKGKVIYLDFWATWCGPCKEEMTHSNKLKLKLENEAVDFVYLGIQSSEKSWKISIAENQLKGEHYLLTNDQYKVLSERFGILTIPRYILIDQNGEVVDSNAPKPSESKQIMEAINKLLDDK